MDLENTMNKDNNSLSMQFPPDATARIDAMAEFYGCDAGQIVAQGLLFMEERFLIDADAKQNADVHPPTKDNSD